jgi:pyrimidine deaminase RibD-like protein
MASFSCIYLYSGGERGTFSAYPRATCAAVLVAKDGRVLGKGLSDYNTDCVQVAFADAGLEAIPLEEWCVTWPISSELRSDLAAATLYLTLEPSAERQGEALPPITRLIRQCGIKRVVIGSPDPIPEFASLGASNLHANGIRVTVGSCLREECDNLIRVYSEKANSKLQRMARQHFSQFKRPLGFLHCSVVDSDNVEAFARHGNAFGKTINGQQLSYRHLGAYESKF